MSSPYLDRAFAHPDVQAAWQAGRKHRAYELLCEMRDRSLDPQEKEALRELCAWRRNFLEPGGSPGLGSINGVGATLYGSAEPDSDGTHIATHCFVVLFIPIFPFGEYLVRPAQGGLLRRSWEIFGKVPVSQRTKTWRKISLGLGAAAAILFFAVAAIGGYTRAQVAHAWATNDLDVEVTVAVGDTERAVAPHHVEDLGDVRKGSAHVVIKRSDTGRVLEEYDTDVKGGADALVINPLGLSPVYFEEVHYGDVAEPPDVALHAGERIVSFDDVDYAFAPLPESIQSKSDRIVKKHVGIGEGGADDTFAYLADREPERRLELIRARALAEPEDHRAAERALDTFDGYPAQLDFAMKLLALAPDDTNLHRLRIGFLDLTGKHAEALAEYQARFDKQRDDPNTAYLYASLLPRKRALEVLAPFQQSRSAYVIRYLGHLQREERRCDEALGRFERLLQAPHQHRVVYDDHAACLVELGRVKEALELGKRITPEEAADRNVLLSDGAVVRRAREQALTDAAPERLFVGELPQALRALLYATWGVEPSLDGLDAAARSVPELLMAARRDPDRALELAAALDDQTLEGKVPYAALLLLAGEAARRDDATLCDRALRCAEGQRGPYPALRRFLVERTESAELEELDRSVQAVVAFVRARRERDPNKRDALLEAARRDDDLFAFVSDAAANWPAVTPKKK